MKNTSALFYLPTVIFAILFYGIVRWGETPFGIADKSTILILLGLSAMAISGLIRYKKLGERKKEYYWVHFVLLGIFTLALFLPMG